MYSVPDNTLAELSRAINPDYLRDESALVTSLCAQAEMDADSSASIRRTASDLVEAVRLQRAARSGLDAFLDQYDLSSAEGVVLMCLASKKTGIRPAKTGRDTLVTH